MGLYKRKRKAGEWACEHGCDQARYIKTTGGYCPHLEKLLGAGKGKKPKGEATGKNSKLVYFHDMGRVPDTPLDVYEGNETDDEAELRGKLAAAGLSEKKIDVVVDRLVRGKTFREIAADHGYAAKAAAKVAYDDAVKQLRRRGFGGKA